jgi:hypothetical protein
MAIVLAAYHSGSVETNDNIGSQEYVSMKKEIFLVGGVSYPFQRGWIGERTFELVGGEL